MMPKYAFYPGREEAVSRQHTMLPTEKVYAQLRRSARQSCAWRGHLMTPFKLEVPWYDGPLSRLFAISKCRNCGMDVAVNTHPLPNEIDVGGEAVALNCRKGESR